MLATGNWLSPRAEDSVLTDESAENCCGRAATRCPQKGGFWDGKVPCWQLRECIAELCDTCPAYIDQSRPCWLIENTPCKTLLDMSTCSVCIVHSRYGSE